MVQADGGDSAAEGGGDDVGGVGVAPHPHLQADQVHPLGGKPQKGDGSVDFKLAGVEALSLHRIADGLHPLGEGGQGGGGDHLPVDLKALAELEDKGGDISPHPVSGGLQGGGHHGGGGALAVGAGDMDAAQPVLGVAQPAHQLPHPREAGFGQAPAAAVDISEGLFIGHGVPPFLRPRGGQKKCGRREGPPPAQGNLAVWQ